MSRLSDQVSASLRETINNAIHELVFAAHHIDEDDPDRAADCLVTVQMSLDSVGEKLAEASS